MTISLATYRTPTTNTLDSLFDSLFDPFFESVTIPTKKKTNAMVSTKVTTEDDKHIISVAAPGLDKEDFNITITEGTLTVQTGEADTEFGTSAFTKTWTLPEGTTADKISADYKQGILRVTIEKPEVTVPETVTIKVT
jgi:HSP20 family protein|tara:strand:- start:222 stop:635 length:414 start_codon:yes stop_codon:yes gene_type:complete